MQLRNLVLGLAVLTATPALADTPDNYAFGFSGYDGLEQLTLNGTSIATNGFQGWVSPSPGHPNTAGPDGNANYIAGTCCNGGGDVFANYFVFDISSFMGPVNSASFSLSPYSVTQNFTFVLHDATPYVSSLHDAISPDPVLYSELGTGAILGSFAITTSDSYGAPLTFTLNSTALSHLNADIAAGDHQFAISGTVLGQAGSTGAVPEPASWALMLGGFGLIGGTMRAARRSDERFTRKLRSRTNA